MTDGTRLAVTSGMFLCSVLGWLWGDVLGGALGSLVGSATLMLPWRGQPLWRWAQHWLRRNRSFSVVPPVMVTNDRSGGGIRYQDGVAVAAVQILGKPHRATLFTGSTTSQTSNGIDARSIVPLLRHSLGMEVESVSILTAGSRRCVAGDYPRVYDTLLGSAPYAGTREMWLVVRIRALGNGDAFRCRPTVGTAALATAQRIASALRTAGIRARVATSTEIVDLDRRLGASGLRPQGRRWHTLRSETGWMTTYAYRAADISTESLAQAWSLKADGIVQNVTIFPDGTCCAALTVRTSQPPTAPPSVGLKTLPGEQASAQANNLCGPRWEVRGQSRGLLPASLWLPAGPSGILLGKVSEGNRLLLPIGDPGDPTRVMVIADDKILKRIVIRAAAAGERITVHSNDIGRWYSVRMPHVMVTDQPRPAPGTTLSVTDGTVSPTPRPPTVVEVGSSGTGRGGADVVITQTDPATLEVRTAGRSHIVEMEFFRAENRYASADTADSEDASLHMVGVR
ncbi:MAG: type VII secretion protein EccE [Mycobacterium sp.]|nr:type VII secretion protein EccE [Mycobacterium sp.]